ncbi:MAG: hypothetical protein ACI9O2_000894 [Flammeovirgaceae bacterium]|jgi:hypothetical protein
MSNKASNQVHELIHSMAPAEKRYFKLYAERHSGSSKNNYHILFQAIENQSEYDQESILNQFKGDPFVKHFSIAKNRLYHQILRSLDAFHAESSVESELQRYLHYVEILFQKTLYKQCSRVLSTAEKIAKKHEKQIVLLRIIKWKKKLIEVRHHEEKDPKLYEDQNKLLLELALGNELWKIKATVFEELFRVGQARSQEMADRSILDLDSLYKFKGKSEVFETNHLIYHTESAIYFRTGHYEKCKIALAQNLALIEEHLHLAAEEPILYHSVLTNLIYVSAKLNQFDDVKRFLDESRSLPEKLKINPTEHIEYRIFSDSYELELAICNLTGNTSRGKELIEVIPPMLVRWQHKHGDVRRASFLHGLSVMFFTLGSLGDSLKWNNELLNTISIKKAEDSFCFGQIFHAVLHFELGNTDLLSGIIKSLNRYLDTRERRYKFEEHFIKLAKNLEKYHSDSDERKYFETFIDAVSPFENEDYEKIAFEYFDFIAWAQSHLSGIPFQEAVRERVTMKNVL